MRSLSLRRWSLAVPLAGLVLVALGCGRPPAPEVVVRAATTPDEALEPGEGLDGEVDASDVFVPGEILPSLPREDRSDPVDEGAPVDELTDEEEPAMGALPADLVVASGIPAERASPPAPFGSRPIDGAP